VHVYDILNVKKSENSNLVQAYIESLIRFSFSWSKLLTLLNQSRSICGWTILSLAATMTYRSTATMHVAHVLVWVCTIVKYSCHAGEWSTWRRRTQSAFASHWIILHLITSHLHVLTHNASTTLMPRSVEVAWHIGFTKIFNGYSSGAWNLHNSTANVCLFHAYKHVQDFILEENVLP